MSYFVILPDGQRFGPTDLPTLNQWAAEGRIAPNCEIEDIATLGRLKATEFPGLNLPGIAPPQGAQNWERPPESGSPYPRGGNAGISMPGTTEVTLGWILGALVFVVCCPVLPGVGLYLSNKAIALGNPAGNAPRIFNIVLLTLSILVIVGYAIFVVAMISLAPSSWR